jgi:hypothetical protein
MNGLSKTVQKDLRTVSNQSQGIYVGIGIKRYSIFGKYRLSELIESSYAPELPPYTVGIQIGFF